MHQHLAIGLTERRTATIVAKDFRTLGFKIAEGIGKTGVINVLENVSGSTERLWFYSRLPCQLLSFRREEIK